MFDLLRGKIRGFIKKAGDLEREKEGFESKFSKVSKLKKTLFRRIKLSESDVENILWEFQLDLIQADVALETSEEISKKLEEKILGEEIEKGKLEEFLREKIRETLLEIMKPKREINLVEEIERCEDKPFKIVFLGINGSGKTTTIAKVGKYLLDNNLSVVFAAGDTFRAGAIEQLEKHADNLGIKVIKHKKGADPAAVIYDAVQHAKAKGIDVVLADTAGRMQTNVNLMKELEKICRVNKPHLKIFVADALTGNDAVDQARKFNEEIGIDAVILTKMDSDAKGGCAISIAHETNAPIIFIGTGQNYSDLKAFDRNWFIEKILS